MSKVEQKQFVYCLEQYDPESRTALFKVREAIPMTSPWNKMYVEVSKYLAGAIKTGKNKGLRRGDTFVGTKFTSTDSDVSFANNPFKLKHFIPDNAETGVPEHFVLELVNEREASFKEVEHVTGGTYSKMIKRFIKSSNYRRYVKCITSVKFTELNPNIRIIDPVVA